MPAPVADAAMTAAFPQRCWLTGDQHGELLRRLARLGIEGGMVYDALVGESARQAHRRLLTRDARALRVYDLLGVGVDLVE